MSRNATSSAIIALQEDGVLEHVGACTDISETCVTSSAEMLSKVTALRKLFADAGLNLSKNPSLARLLQQSEDYCAPQENADTFDKLFSVLQTSRIADPLLSLHGVPGGREKLIEMLEGELDFLKRRQSRAKDTFWELEVRELLGRAGIESSFSEPDLIVSVADSSVGVACKKLYSEANVEKVLSNAVGQIKSNCGSGFVAVDIGDLLPENAILQLPTLALHSSAIGRHIDGFMQRNDRIMKKYLEPGRAIAFLVSCAAIADAPKHRPRFLNAQLTVVWGVPTEVHEKQQLFEEIRSAFLGGANEVTGLS